MGGVASVFAGSREQLPPVVRGGKRGDTVQASPASMPEVRAAPTVTMNESVRI